MLGDDDNESVPQQIIHHPVARVSNEPYLGNLEGLSYIPRPYEAPEFES